MLLEGVVDIDKKVVDLYDSLAHDSGLELENIREDIDSVIVYGKIPRRSISIPTVDGQTYSPDFMYLLKQKDGTQILNLVVFERQLKKDKMVSIIDDVLKK